MLKVTVPGVLLHDPKTDRIFRISETVLTLEHSLVSISKWESKWHKPFLNQELSFDEFDDYVRCMTLTQNVDPNVYSAIPSTLRDEIRAYMDDPMTATVIREQSNNGGSTQFITSELIYYWMTALQIPFDPCQKWHINRLITLIRVANIKQKPSKKMSAVEAARRSHSINTVRRAARKH